MTTAAPRTIPECDKLLIDTHERYLRAMDRLTHTKPDPFGEVHGSDAVDAAELWIQLHELLDLRKHLPQQRTG